MKYHKRTAAVATLVAGALVLAGCGRESEPEPQPGTATEAEPVDESPATGVLQVWAMGNEGELLPDFLEEFESQNPDVTITVTSIPWGEARQRIETAIAGGQTPDMSLLDLGFMPSFVALDGLRAVPDGVVEPGVFFEGAQQSTQFDGAMYAVPWYVSTRVLFYRSDIAAQAGTSAPATWDELTGFAQALKDAGATYGTVVPAGAHNSWQGVLPYFWGAGGSVLTEDGSGFDLGSEAMVEGLTFIAELAEAGLAPTDVPQQSGELQAAFVNDTYGSFVSGPWEVTSLRNAGGAEFVENNLGAAVLPAGSAGPNPAYLGGGAFGVFEDAENPDAAWKLIRWLSQPQTQLAWYRVASVLPSVQSAWDDPALRDGLLMDVFAAQLENSQGPPPVRGWAEVGAVIDRAVEQVIRGTSTPEEAAAQIQSEASVIGVN